MALTRARSVVLWVLALEVAVLVATGVLLYFFYRPDAAAAWSDIDSVHTSITFGGLVRDVHRWTAYLTVWTTVLAALLLAIRAQRAESVPRGILLGGGLVLGVVAAQFTGYLLPWDQLALWQVTVGTNMMGYSPIFQNDQVRFVLIGGTEVAPSTLFKFFALHVALSVAVTGLTGLAWRRARRSPAVPPAMAPADDSAIEVPVGV